MSEFMIVTCRRETCNSVAVVSPWIMLRTTVSGTKRAKASVPRDKRRNASCNSRTSRILERRPGCNSTNSADSWAKSKSPSRRMRRLSRRSGRDTKAPTPIPTRTLAATTPQSSAPREARYEFTSPKKYKSISSRPLSVERFPLTARAPKVPAGKTMTKSHVVCTSRSMDTAPTCKQSPSRYAPGAQAHSAKPSSARLRLKLNSGNGESPTCKCCATGSSPFPLWSVLFCAAFRVAFSWAFSGAC
mmetsp:Transcript_2583/g.7787  ORF Transcript_2583/g.7787 Transcript_2583/m.7787 type:complete len:245 (-) Transcript_2583:765-1499(-)